jgi:hypothetical protein
MLDQNCLLVYYLNVPVWSKPLIHLQIVFAWPDFEIMKIKKSIIIAGCFLRSSIASAVPETPRRPLCHTPEPTTEFLDFANDWAVVLHPRQAENISVPVYFHIASTSAKYAAVSDQKVADQVSLSVVSNYDGEFFSYLPLITKSIHHLHCLL